MTKVQNPNFINTSEAFSRKVFIFNDTIVIPYISLNITRNNLFIQNGGYLNFSYYIFEKVTSLKFESESTLISAKNSEYSNALLKEYVIVGGYDKDYKGAELEVAYKTSFLLLPDDFEYSITPFIPKDYPLMKSNMNSDKIESFFNLVNAPKNLIEELGSKYWVLTI